MWNDLSYLLKSKNAKKILSGLDEPKLASRVAKELDLRLPSTCRTISTLEDRKLVRSLTTDRQRFRFFKITPRGKKTMKNLFDL